MNGIKVTLTDQAAVESAIMTNNSARFRLTNATPMMQIPMVFRLGYLANGELAQSILNGNLEDDDYMDEYTKRFLHFIGQQNSLPLLSSSITPDDYIKYWRSSREKRHPLSPVDTLGTTRQRPLVLFFPDIMPLFYLKHRDMVFLSPAGLKV